MKLNLVEIKQLTCCLFWIGIVSKAFLSLPRWTTPSRPALIEQKEFNKIFLNKIIKSRQRSNSEKKSTLTTPFKIYKRKSSPKSHDPSKNPMTRSDTWSIKLKKVNSLFIFKCIKSLVIHCKRKKIRIESPYTTSLYKCAKKQDGSC